MGTRRPRQASEAPDSSSSNKQQRGQGAARTARQRLKVLYDFEYETRAGKRVRIVKDEQLLLLSKTNDDWWQTVRPEDLAVGAASFYVPEHATFYVPTGYVALEPADPAEPAADPPASCATFYVQHSSRRPEVDCQSSPAMSAQQPRPKHSSDSFRSKIIRKLSGQQQQQQQQQPSSRRQQEPASALGMCFGKGSSADEPQLNPFQEELESALSHRQQRRPSRVEQQQQPPHVPPVETSSPPSPPPPPSPPRQPRQPPVEVDPIINDKRKMWAIETLMSELLLGAAAQEAPPKTEACSSASTATAVSGPKQLAQELHDMRRSTREIQLEPRRRSQAAKLLDQYNEANILAVDSEPPSYSSVSLRLRREPEMEQQQQQLSPSLEKLAQEIKFLPAAMTRTTISQDSLRLYKRRSKSEPQLLLAEAPPPKQQPRPERKYTQYEQQRHALGAAVSSSKYKLRSKSRSLGDLDCSSHEQQQQQQQLDEAEHQEQLRRRYKPTPKLRSKDSFKRIMQLARKPSTASVGFSAGKLPVPAKRRIQQHTANSSYDELLLLDQQQQQQQLDIERSTAVGFKSLLRASDSGSSEECLQSKTLTSLPWIPLLNKTLRNQQQHASNDNLSSSPSLSSETILTEPDLVDNLVELPPGWRQIYDSNAKRYCYVSDRGDKWFSSSDAEGKIYFFEENSNESSWALPSIANSKPSHRTRTTSNGDWPQLFDGNMFILKEGLINKTKITTENGKKLRKAWSLSYAVLTELFLLFFKDAKTCAAMKMDQCAAAKPEITVDLNGAFIEPADKLSNRKNVYLINTLLGLQVLVQSDNALAIAEWYQEINDAIQRLPFSQECRRSTS